AIHSGAARLCSGRRGVVAERQRGLPVRRHTHARELAMDPARCHADQPCPDGDRSGIGWRCLTGAADEVEHASCGTDRTWSPGDAVLPVGAGVSVTAAPSADRARPAGARPLNHSHSMVAGGFDEMSYTTRLTPRTSLMMRVESRARSSSGRRAQSAVMPSVERTARMAITLS